MTDYLLMVKVKSRSDLDTLSKKINSWLRKQHIEYAVYMQQGETDYL